MSNTFRNFVVTLLTLSVVTFSFAAGATDDSGSATTTTVSSGAFSEAPMLAKLVSSGDLPPVEDRLPPSPLVVEVKDQIGEYGGKITAIKHSPSNWYMIAHVNIEPLMELHPENNLNIVPNVAESWSWNSDTTELIN